MVFVYWGHVSTTWAGPFVLNMLAPAGTLIISRLRSSPIYGQSIKLGQRVLNYPIWEGAWIRMKFKLLAGGM